MEFQSYAVPEIRNALWIFSTNHMHINCAKAQFHPVNQSDESLGSTTNYWRKRSSGKSEIGEDKKTHFCTPSDIILQDKWVDAELTWILLGKVKNTDRLLIEVQSSIFIVYLHIWRFHVDLFFYLTHAVAGVNFVMPSSPLWCFMKLSKMIELIQLDTPFYFL